MDSHPRFFIVRNPGPSGTDVEGAQLGKRPTIVPLIPADILPPWVKIEGYPRELSIEQTAGMTSLGGYLLEEGYVNLQLFDLHMRGDFSPDAKLNVAPMNEPPVNSSQVDDVGAVNTDSSARRSEQRHEDATPRGPLAGGRRSEKNKPNKRQKFGKPRSYPMSRQSSLNSEFYNAEKDTFERRNRLGLCQEWCHHGVCKRGDRCHLSHHMPQAPWELKAIGLDKVPAWWKRSARREEVAASHEQRSRRSHPQEMKRKAPLPIAGAVTGTVVDLPREGLVPGTLNPKLNVGQDEELLVQY